MRLLLAGIALGTFAGVVVLLSLLWKPQRVAARPYVEPEDGVQPVDPYPDVQAMVVERARRDPAYRTMLMEDAVLATDFYFETLVCGVAVCNWSGPRDEFETHPHVSW